jgi:peptidyl-dipeptidase A
MTSPSPLTHLAVGLCLAAMLAVPLVAAQKPTVAEAKAFMDAAEARLMDLWIASERASWVQATFITDDTEALAAQAREHLIAATMDLAKLSRRFDGFPLPADLARRFTLLRLSLALPAPDDPKLAAELTRITAAMEGAYGKGKYCPPGKDACLDLQDLSRIMATSRNPDELLDAWRGWHAIAPPMRKDFERYAELANTGARTLGYADMGAYWRSKYDMPPDDFGREVERLWQQVKPLYEALHAYARHRLVQAYGEKVVPPAGPIPAHLLGNMWAQSWGNVYPLLAPPNADPGYDLTALLRAKKLDEREMVRYGERFFTSLGFPPLPQTFWERSLFTKPRDRDVVCHPSAWDIDWADDLRLKMCIEITAEDFATVHHELGHNFYQRAYSHLPPLFRDGANEGFHEAIGDTIALSVTPGYLVRVGLLDKEPPAEQDLGLLLQMALEKVAFLPFGMIIDQWRWQVFSGEVTPAGYNAAWWTLRERVQGVRAPLPRSEADFDPGAKYHVPANVSYTRYFLADILQFQFHRALCREAGYTGPLSRCSIFGNAEAGKRFREMLEMGASRPWPDALEAVTGQRQMDAGALLEYFAPLKAWLDEQNRGVPVGWQAR